MLTVPELEPHCGSWIIAENGIAVCELFHRESVMSVARFHADAPEIQIFTAAQWLARVNAQVAA